ncbi:hypothetical protein C8R47DRAFT_211770 [Mycena vitilis]|nr:hypothetical protein C8R47DRAFT_211770 [Mycena vitilis]
MSISGTGSLDPAPAPRHADLLNRDNPMVAAPLCPGSRAVEGFSGGNHHTLDLSAESRVYPPAPAQLHAALLKGAGPMAYEARRPVGRAKTPADRAKREGFEAHTQSCDSLSGPEGAVRGHAIAAAGCAHAPDYCAPATALWSAAPVEGTLATTAFCVPADPHAHGPCPGWLPDVFRVASFGTAVLVLAFVLVVYSACWLSIWKPTVSRGFIWGFILAGNTPPSPSFATSRMKAWDKFRPRSCSSRAPVASLGLYDRQILDSVAEDYARSTATGSRPHTGGGSTLNTGQSAPAARASRDSYARRTRTSRSDGARPEAVVDTAEILANARDSYVKVMYWNIYHSFTLKLTDPDFHVLLREYDTAGFISR